MTMYTPLNVYKQLAPIAKCVRKYASCIFI